MRLTGRDLKVLAKLAAARWLTTTQIAALCFPAASMEMARRRLRLLREADCVVSVRSNQMAEALHTLGSKSKALLLANGWKHEIRLDRTPPRNLEHHLGINDIRVAVERSAEQDGVAVGFFFASWELQQQGWRFPIVPDAACHVERPGRSATAFFEYDRGEERPGYLLRNKFTQYAHGLEGFSLSPVVTVVDTEARLEQLRRYLKPYLSASIFSFIEREALRRSWSVSQLLDQIDQTRCAPRCADTTVWSDEAS